MSEGTGRGGQSGNNVVCVGSGGSSYAPFLPAVSCLSACHQVEFLTCSGVPTCCVLRLRFLLPCILGLHTHVLYTLRVSCAVLPCHRPSIGGQEQKCHQQAYQVRPHSPSYTRISTFLAVSLPNFCTCIFTRPLNVIFNSSK